MKIGGSFRLREIRRKHWEACARELRLPIPMFLDRADSILERLPDAAQQVAAELQREGLGDPIIGRLVAALAAHARTCRERLAVTDA